MCSKKSFGLLSGDNMKEIVGNLWTFQFPNTGPEAYIRCITTNGFIKQNGQAVMGRGCAAEACRLYPGAALRLGQEIKIKGNVCIWINTGLLTFPVKHNWWEKADLELIAKSAQRLNYIARYMITDKWYILPRPGCGNGSRSWDEVRPILEGLPDNVLVIDFEKIDKEKKT
jgi:hypothetical protein